MTSAFMFLNCDPNQIEAAKSKLKKVSRVASVYETTGIYDIIRHYSKGGDEFRGNIEQRCASDKDGRRNMYDYYDNSVSRKNNKVVSP